MSIRVVACLCADWCGVCREFRPVFERAAQAHPDMRFQWIDIEDEADLIGDIDVQTFPTLLIADGAEPRFFGPVLPREAALATAMRSAEGASTGLHGAAIRSLTQRLGLS
jgi:thiol-disulfide isomerase/thioredoxin